ncbi:unnamed protein product [Haemonchus placei]|uniref:Cache_3-Cache_2 domain-containing protein n=1 Tax=Haemonchus placei TaxID=6290 RepID=A0A0N4WYY9_HAEPC|nr:unnamed protein product [Haemonchus placei]
MPKVSRGIGDRAKASPERGAQDGRGGAQVMWTVCEGYRRVNVSAKELSDSERKIAQQEPSRGAKVREIGEGVMLYYNEEETKRNGVVIAVAEFLKDSVSAINRINDRIMAVSIGHQISSGRRYLIIASDLNGHVGGERSGLERVPCGRVVGVSKGVGENP